MIQLSSFQKIAVALVVCFVLAFGLYKFNRPSADRTLEDSIVAIDSAQLHENFIRQDSAAIDALLNEIIEVSGQVESVQGKTVLLIPGIVCGMEELPSDGQITDGQSITLKGRLLGFDDLFDEVQLDFCVMVLPS